MKTSEVQEGAWKARPFPIPTKIVPDFDALYETLSANGWLVLEPPPIDHRTTSLGVLESKMVRDFKNWMIGKRRKLAYRRIGEYRWYLTIG